MIQAPPGTPTRSTLSSGEYRFSRRRQAGSPGAWTSWRRASTPETPTESSSTPRRSSPVDANPGKASPGTKPGVSSGPSWGFSRMRTTPPAPLPVSSTRRRIRIGIRWKSRSRTFAADSTCIFSDLPAADHRERGLVILDKSTYETTLQRMSGRVSNTGHPVGSDQAPGGHAVLRGLSSVSGHPTRRPRRLCGVQAISREGRAVFRSRRQQVRRARRSRPRSGPQRARASGLYVYCVFQSTAAGVSGLPPTQPVSPPSA